MNNIERPLSPHLTIYRWPVTMILSILHRITGLAMSFGLLVLAAWLVNAAAGPHEYQVFRAGMATAPAKLLLLAWSFAFFLHLGNGLRHLVWDTGRGLEKRQASRSAWGVLVIAVGLTAAFWWLA
jgi:succinate dehydrogenase / fumarate reductase cytochrome b subunit